MQMSHPISLCFGWSLDVVSISNATNLPSTSGACMLYKRPSWKYMLVARGYVQTTGGGSVSVRMVVCGV